MNPVMYILSDPSLEMSAGKLAAQCSHAAVEAYRLSCKQGEQINAGLRGVGENFSLFEETAITNRWRRGGHYSKIVLQCDDLWTANAYLNGRGFKSELIIDEGRTEFDADLTPTAIGVEIVDKDSGHVQDTFSAFKLYPPTLPRPVVIECAGRMNAATLDSIRRAAERGDIAEARAVARKPKRRSWRKFL